MNLDWLATSMGATPNPAKHRRGHSWKYPTLSWTRQGWGYIKNFGKFCNLKKDRHLWGG